MQMFDFESTGRYTCMDVLSTFMSRNLSVFMSVKWKNTGWIFYNFLVGSKCEKTNLI